MMKEINPTIIELPAMNVISFHGFGLSPEPLAWLKMFEWLEAHEIISKINTARFFGFNNPDPSPGSPNYGYEVWMVVDQDSLEAGEGEYKRIPGCLYAVIQNKNLIEIGEDWQKLNRWLVSSDYVYGNGQWLEECKTVKTYYETIKENFDPTKMAHDLFMPIQKKPLINEESH